MSAAKELCLALHGRWSEQRQSGTAKCPAHDDKTPSLSISVGRKAAVVLRCHAGCDSRDAHAAIRGLVRWPSNTHLDLLPPTPQPVLTVERIREELKRSSPAHLCRLAVRYFEEGRGVFRTSRRYDFASVFVTGLPAPITQLSSPPSSAFSRVRPQALHYTFLRDDCSGNVDIDPSRLYSGPKSGGCVKLVPDVEITYGLGIGQGIENGLVAIAASWPTWACLDAAILLSFRCSLASRH